MSGPPKLGFQLPATSTPDDTNTTEDLDTHLIASWLAFLAACIYVYFSRADWGPVQGELQRAVSASTLLGYAVYLLLGCVRGFTLIPSTNLVLLAVLLFPPVPLFFLTLLGILVSSASIYWFSEALHLDEYFERNHSTRLAKMKNVLERNEMAIIVGWSFFPLAPTDAICYLCGVMVNVNSSEVYRRDSDW